MYSNLQDEVPLVKMLNRQDPYEKYHIVKIKEDFMWRNCQLVVFEWLPINLCQLIKQNNHIGESLEFTRNIGMQIAKTLKFFSLRGIKVIHCNLKPENIFFCENSKEVKLVGFGLSCQYGKKYYKKIQSMSYRSPEIILGNFYDYSVDVWSLGCILMEIHTGQVLFNSKNEVDLMIEIVELLGMPPKSFLVRSSETSKYFNKLPNGSYKLNDPKNGPNSRKLHEIIGVFNGRSKGRIFDVDHSKSDYLKFEDLIKQMLEWDPLKRIKPVKILEHDFFKIKTVKNWAALTPRSFALGP